VVLRKLTLLAALVFTALLITAIPVAAAPLATLQASLTGEKEVPGPGDKDGIGTPWSRSTKQRCATGLRSSA
jgi:hypothetical protein